jgi:hypothetical protein
LVVPIWQNIYLRLRLGRGISCLGDPQFTSCRALVSSADKLDCFQHSGALTSVILSPVHRLSQTTCLSVPFHYQRIWSVFKLRAYSTPLRKEAEGGKHRVQLLYLEETGGSWVY